MKPVKLNLIPEENIFFDQKNNVYKISALPARCRLFINEKTYLPEGWCVIKGFIKRRGKALRVKVILNDTQIYLPVSCKGTILELLQIPPETKEIIFEPMDSLGEFEVVGDFYLKPVCELERFYRMFRRTIFFFKKHFKNQRKILGLSFKTLVFNFKRAYELANKIRDCDSDIELSYSEWSKKFYDLKPGEKKEIINDLRKSKIIINFCILIYNEDNDKRELNNTIKSLERQFYKNLKIFVFNSSSQINLKDICEICHPQYTYLILLKSGTILPEYSLYWIAKVATTSDANLIYSDHDYIDSNLTRNDPFFKPDFSLEYLRSKNYIDYAFAVKAGIVSQLDESDIRQCWDDSHRLIFKIIEITNFDGIIHIPAVLFHFPFKNKESRFSDDNPVKEHFERLGINASSEKIGPGIYRNIYYAKDKPFISIIIPTRNKCDILRRCIESILKISTYQNYEILIVDNQTTDSDAINYMNNLSTKPKIRILTYEDSFNFSAMNNFAANQAKGEVLLLLNNDTEVITPQWMEIMLGCLQQPRVGAVGVKLYYPDGRIQHAGVVIGSGGCADHAFKGFDRFEKGYIDRLIVQQEYCAVTAACMMTWKKLFFDVGGFDEKELAVSFNDVDYCLKLRERGYRIIFTPFVELYHYESLSRGKDSSEEAVIRSKREADYIRKKWRKYIEYDPFYNPNLNYKKPDFSLNLFPRIKKPWEKR